MKDFVLTLVMAGYGSVREIRHEWSLDDVAQAMAIMESKQALDKDFDSQTHWRKK